MNIQIIPISYSIYFFFFQICIISETKKKSKREKMERKEKKIDILIFKLEFDIFTQTFEILRRDTKK